MAQSEEVHQRRREKILSRITTSEEDAEAASSEASVFLRYKQLKEQEQNEKQLIRVSRYTGLLILPLSYQVAPWVAYALITLLLVVRALWVTRNRLQEKKEADWITKIFPPLAALQQLKHLGRLVLVARATFNSLLSFVMAAVLFNAASILIHKNHFSSSPSQL